jgi:DNA repair exonuclease SbcCD ATPase subunit
LSKVLEENNRLREENLNNQKNQNMNNINNINNMNSLEDEITDLKNNLNQYEDKFDYFNEYINNIKLQIKNIFNDLLSIINKYDSPYANKKYSDEFKNKLKDLKSKIDNIKEIDRFNLDSTDDEKCLQSYMNLVKILLNELENKQKINDNINKNFNKIRNDNLNNLKNKNDNTKRQLIDLIDVIKQIIKNNATKQLISDAVNIINNLSNLYKVRNGNGPVGNEKINKEIRELENELDYIKKLILNQNNNNKNNNLTYEMNYSNSKNINSKLDDEMEKNADNNLDTIENKKENGKFNENGYYFDYD